MKVLIDLKMIGLRLTAIFERSHVSRIKRKKISSIEIKANQASRLAEFGRVKHVTVSVFPQSLRKTSETKRKSLNTPTLKIITSI